jgi:hypothetical protein
MGQSSLVIVAIGSCAQGTQHMKVLPGVPNKREFLAQLFGRLGVLGLLEHLAAALRPGLVVLTYHRIAEPGIDSFYDPVISATPDAFRAEVEWLRCRYRILSLPALLARLESGERWHEPAALLTFDDGYRDNFEVAVPILHDCEVPATFFLPTAFLEAPRLPWWDHVAYVIKQTRARRLVFGRGGWCWSEARTVAHRRSRWTWKPRRDPRRS